MSTGEVTRCVTSRRRATPEIPTRRASPCGRRSPSSSCVRGIGRGPRRLRGSLPGRDGRSSAYRTFGTPLAVVASVSDVRCSGIDFPALLSLSRQAPTSPDAPRSRHERTIDSIAHGTRHQSPRSLASAISGSGRGRVQMCDMLPHAACVLNTTSRRLVGLILQILFYSRCNPPCETGPPSGLDSSDSSRAKRPRRLWRPLCIRT